MSFVFECNPDMRKRASKELGLPTFFYRMIRCSGSIPRWVEFGELKVFMSVRQVVGA